MVVESIVIAAAGSLVEKLVIPKIKTFCTSLGTAYKKHLIPTGEHFLKYYDSTYKHYSIVNSLALKNSKRNIKNIYVPLTLELNTIDKKTTILLDKFPTEFINEFNNILIIDTAGMGKSTLSKRMYLDVIDNGCKIPIFIELQRLSKDKKILDEIAGLLSPLSENFDKKLLLDFIESGEFVFFLDGYDEISLDDLAQVTTDLQDFIIKAHKNQFILTSRPDTSLCSFTSFQEVSIAPLTKDEAYSLLKKYDSNGDISSLLIKKLESGEYESVMEFLGNPLLVSLLFVAFEHKPTIPLKKHLFYRQVYDAYFESHDLTKGRGYTHDKRSKLDSDDFHRVLRYLGYASISRNKTTEFEKDELLALIEKARKYCHNLNFKESDFFADILTSVPLFCKNGNAYKWAHKSLQEYFAAQFIFLDTKDKQKDVLQKICNNENITKYFNLLDLYYDIDNDGFLICILKPFLEQFIDDYKSLKTELEFSDDDIEFRKEHILYSDFTICVCPINDFTKNGMRMILDSSYFSHSRIDNNTLLISCKYRDLYIQLLKILRSKKYIFGRDYKIIFNDFFSAPIAIDLIDDIESNEFISINLDKDNPLNKDSELFNKINNLISFIGYFPIKKAKEELSKIDEIIRIKADGLDWL